MGRLRERAWCLAFALSACADPASPRAAAKATSVLPSRPAPSVSASSAAVGLPEEPHDANPAPTPFRSSEVFTLKIEGGEVITGDGSPKHRADVLVRGEEIAYVGLVDASVKAERVIDAKGAVVTPGFIDMHSHLDPDHVEVALAQGVTLAVLGQDGTSPSKDIAAWLRHLDEHRPRIDIATLAGHVTVRGPSVGPLDADGRAKAAKRVERAMDDGAFGLSTGLEYDGGRDADLAELVALATPVGKRGGVVMSHLRSEDDDRIEASIDELITQCQRSGARAHIAHFKSVLGHGAARAKDLLDRLAKARGSGLEITADAYPYDASYTTLAILFPDFARPPHDYARVVAKRRADVAAFLHDVVLKRNGPSATLFGDGKYRGRTLEDVATATKSPFEDILVELGPDGGSAAYFVMDDELQSALLLDPNVSIGSDGGGGSSHPRAAGAFARFIEEYVMKRGALTLESAIEKMTDLAARTLGIEGQTGCLRAGCTANVDVFVPAEVVARATYTEPRALARGMRFVIVRGHVALDHEQFTKETRGRPLRFKAPAAR